MRQLWLNLYIECALFLVCILTRNSLLNRSIYLRRFSALYNKTQKFPGTEIGYKRDTRKRINTHSLTESAVLHAVLFLSQYSQAIVFRESQPHRLGSSSPCACDLLLRIPCGTSPPISSATPRKGKHIAHRLVPWSFAAYVAD
jgi:hypothetical protein